MTEPIKQEIINNIFENGDKLITGPILQTVLIDMIDDVNVKDQEILSKTGSWDEAVTQIPNLATKEEVTNLSESVARDIANVDVDLTGYATEAWVESQGYLKEHQDISGLATKTELNEAKDNLQGNITSLSESVARDIANVSVPEGVATEAWVQSQDYASKSYVDNAVSSSSVDLTGYATETWVQNQGYLTEHQDISNLATKTELNSVSESIQTDISNLATKGELNEAKNIIQEGMIDLSGSVAKTIDDYTAGIITEIQNQDYASKTYVNEAVAGINLSDYATKSELTSVSESVQTDITNLSESVANSAVWKKGTGKDSIVQKLTGDNEANTPTATGTGALALGFVTTASGNNSHAEGNSTNASGHCTHTEGNLTTATGWSSHAEGDRTTASAHCSHAEGNNTNASAGTSHAEGSDTLTLGWSSHAEGQFTTASVHCSHAEGHRSEASGSWSHAEGNGTRTLEQCSHAEGNVTLTLGSYSHAEGNYTTASGESSHAEGDQTIASGSWSHAEGQSTVASGDYSHAEGNSTRASGNGSHAEGYGTEASGNGSHAEGHFTVASNVYEHAQGLYNHSSTNQIFSVGAGESVEGTTTRRNALSVLVGPNFDTRTLISYFFVQNIGGYDGTNPTPGTNDLATVLNNTETWTFTLEDGSTVTKNIVMR